MKKLAAEAIADQDTLASIVKTLSEGPRRERQRAAQVIGLISLESCEALVPHIGVFVSALERPEAQTRWEVLEVLCKLVPFDSRSCDKAVDSAENSLFDEESGLARLAGMRFLCKLGSTTPTRSERVWPLIDEAIQCYHGDQEFQDMLLAVTDFSAGNISPLVKEQLAVRMSFDANNGRGALKRRAQQIVQNVSQ